MTTKVWPHFIIHLNTKHLIHDNGSDPMLPFPLSPFILTQCIRKSQLTLSYAFQKSFFYDNALLLFTFRFPQFLSQRQHPIHNVPSLNKCTLTIMNQLMHVRAHSSSHTLREQFKQTTRATSKWA